MTDWVSVKERNPPPHQPVLIVNNHLALQAIGKPSFGVSVGIYLPDTDSYQDLTDEVALGEVFFWAPLPDVPWDLLFRIGGWEMIRHHFERPNVPLQPPAAQRRAECWTPQRVSNAAGRGTPRP